MITTATRRIQFCSGHRVVGHEGKCRNMHGHNYVAWFTAQADELDDIGRVVDFSVLKQRLGGWVDSYWDHKFIYWEQDKLVQAAVDASGLDGVWVAPFNPTAEEMAAYLLRVVGPAELAGTGVTLVGVRLYETENCVAEVTLS